MSAALNRQLDDLDAYATKEVHLAGLGRAGFVDLSFGLPDFGPPQHLLADIEAHDLTLERFLDASKRYEDPRGSLRLREAISAWYAQRYGLEVDPATEIAVTHGAVAGLTLALLALTEPGGAVAVTDPSYMLYSRTCRVLGRRVARIGRPPSSGPEYPGALDAWTGDSSTQAMIVNSPENPTGYVLERDDWDAVRARVERDDLWLIHDEVYDASDWGRPHLPAFAFDRLRPRTVMVNSFSKKFGMPGLRLGWIAGPPSVIDLVAKLTDYTYLGVSIISEAVGLRLLADPLREKWMAERRDEVHRRWDTVRSALTEAHGFAWPRQAAGAFFAFPDVSELAARQGLRRDGESSGTAVARWLGERCNVGVVPGAIYGPGADASIRFVTCRPMETIEAAMARIREAA